MFGVNDLDSDEVIMDATATENVEQSAKVAEKEVCTADPATTAEVAKNLKAQMQAELEEEERLARLKEEETNIALIES
nr:hypothetical protein [Tanacetum cinerariifolium]